MNSKEKVLLTVWALVLAFSVSAAVSRDRDALIASIVVLVIMILISIKHA